MRVLVDTNVLLRASGSARADGPSLGTVERLTASGAEPCIALQSLVEAWAVMTRAESANGLGMAPVAARQELEAIRAAYTVLADPADFAERFLDLCTSREVVGRQSFDARLVAVMLGHGISRLVTLNGPDFARYREIELIKPA